MAAFAARAECSEESNYTNGQPPALRQRITAVARLVCPCSKAQAVAAAARKLVEIANSVKAVQDGRSGRCPMMHRKLSPAAPTRRTRSQHDQVVESRCKRFRNKGSLCRSHFWDLAMRCTEGLSILILGHR